MPGNPLKFSKGEVNRAGDVFRSYLETGELPSRSELEWASAVVNNFRAAHEYPLQKATMGLRSVVRTVECHEPQVSQRLKRRPTIVGKLRREPNMALARMQDIGGCRAVLNSIDEVERVHARLRKNGRIVRTKNYIKEPAESGYRSLHVVVKYDDRLIEMQIRTLVQHEWAVTVERLGGRLHWDLKSGDGPPELLSFLRAVSAAMGLEEYGMVVDDSMHQELATLRAAAAPHFERR